MYAWPASQVINDTRHDQGQQAGPEQGDIGVVIGAGGRYGDQFRVGVALDPGNCLGDLALFVFSQ
ncbi:hypothetical protein D9M73_237030 [compost metagenome]